MFTLTLSNTHTLLSLSLHVHSPRTLSTYTLHNQNAKFICFSLFLYPHKIKRCLLSCYLTKTPIALWSLFILHTLSLTFSFFLSLTPITHLSLLVSFTYLCFFNYIHQIDLIHKINPIQNLSTPSQTVLRNTNALAYYFKQKVPTYLPISLSHPLLQMFIHKLAILSYCHTFWRCLCPLSLSDCLPLFVDRKMTNKRK